MKKFTISIICLLSCSWLMAQSGVIQGYVKDATTNEPLIGATIRIENTQLGAITDLDGFYSLALPVGQYAITCSYISFIEQKIIGISLLQDQKLSFDFQMEPEVTQIEAVVITASAKRSTVTNLVLLQQKSVSMVSGISNDEIKRSPDRNISDVLKRVSGASVQENRFVVIRGLADRYNLSLMNGISLPSTEPDKRAFSFEIFPSNLLDNLIVYKTATPDLPGEFAGGIIQLNTKEIPEEGFTQFNASLGLNTQSTGKPYLTSVKSSTDWIGLDDGTRAIPATATEEKLESDPYTTSQLFANDWKLIEKSSMRPSQQYQFSMGRHMRVLNRDLGVVGALTYANSPRIVTGERADFNVDLSQKFSYSDQVFKENILTAGLLNLGYKLAHNHKITWNNILTVSAEDQLIFRTGDQFEDARTINAYSMFYTSTSLFNSQLIGEHAQSTGKWKAKWGLSYSQIHRDIPSYRRMLYTNNTDDDQDLYYAYVPFGTPSPNYTGKFYSQQDERFYTANIDLSIPYRLITDRNQFKIGGLYERKRRSFDARVFGYVIPNYIHHDFSLDTLSVGAIFDPQHINENGYVLKESTDKSDSYTAGSELSAGYVMLEQFLHPRLRLIGGIRYERFQQELSSYYVKSTVEARVDTVFNDILPSAHLIFALTDQSNLRASFSQTVTRPNFREIAPFAFYEFLWEAGVFGDPSLKRTQIRNLDLRYELFPGGGQMLAATFFYKRFIHPIELIFINNQGSGTRIFAFQNAPSAYDAGAELEFRMKLSAFDRWLKTQIFSDLTFTGNFSWIKSAVDVSNIPGALPRELYGQSPYIINAGLNYQLSEQGLGVSVLVNRIGRRIWLVGQDQYLHTYEAPRTVLDIQLTKRIFKYGEIKFNAGDILNNQAVFYQDQNADGRFSDGDTPISVNTLGRNFSLGIGIQF